MTANSQHKLVKKHLKNSLFASVSIREALILIDTKQKVIKDRRRDSSNLALNHELALSYIYDCNKILEEIA